ncbi:MAG TPA: cyclase family protein [Thermoleophilaceae bacterium]|jgi:kynurenine formamidase
MARVVDLTQPLGPQTALWPGTGPFAARPTGTVERDGFYAREISLPEHSGTHLDAPAHFAPAGERAHEVAAERLVVPCAVVDVSAECAADPDYGLDRARLERDEAEHGPLPEDGAVLVRTGWDRHRDDPAAYVGRLSFPGLGPSAAELIVERGCTGIGIDTLSVDRGRDATVPVHRITLPAGLWHLEGLVGLEGLPPRGATLFVGALKLVDGSGTPARVLALLP